MHNLTFMHMSHNIYIHSLSNPCLSNFKCATYSLIWTHTDDIHWSCSIKWLADTLHCTDLKSLLIKVERNPSASNSLPMFWIVKSSVLTILWSCRVLKMWPPENHIDQDFWIDQFLKEIYRVNFKQGAGTKCAIIVLSKPKYWSPATTYTRPQYKKFGSRIERHKL